MAALRMLRPESTVHRFTQLVRMECPGGSLCGNLSGDLLAGCPQTCGTGTVRPPAACIRQRGVLEPRRLRSVIHRLSPPDAPNEYGRVPDRLCCVYSPPTLAFRSRYVYNIRTVTILGVWRILAEGAARHAPSRRPSDESASGGRFVRSSLRESAEVRNGALLSVTNSGVSARTGIQYGAAPCPAALGIPSASWLPKSAFCSGTGYGKCGAAELCIGGVPEHCVGGRQTTATIHGHCLGAC